MRILVDVTLLLDFYFQESGINNVIVEGNFLYIMPLVVTLITYFLFARIPDYRPFHVYLGRKGSNISLTTVLSMFTLAEREVIFT